MTDVIRVDLHVHSRSSPDSKLSLDQIAGRLAYTGLRGFALTDHNSVEGHAGLASLRSRFPLYLIVPGVEVSTLEGHLLAYGTDAAPPAHRPIAETIEWVRTHGGEAVLAHPFRRVHGVGRRVAETAPVAALESCNGHNSEIANLRAEGVAAKRSIGMTGGSDAHTITDLGRAYTEIDPSIASVDDLLEAIRRGRIAGGGASMPWASRLRVGLRSGLLMAGRGFRPI